MWFVSRMVSYEHKSFVSRLLRIAASAAFILIVQNSEIGILNARAQSATATLSGTVIDESGAFIPSVNITLLNLGTALQRHATTDDQGSYVVPLLPPGRYNVTAQREGFTTVFNSTFLISMVVNPSCCAVTL